MYFPIQPRRLMNQQVWKGFLFLLRSISRPNCIVNLHKNPSNFDWKLHLKWVDPGIQDPYKQYQDLGEKKRSFDFHFFYLLLSSN